ncbi:MAG: glycerophosphodiester phosphodiesterase family protein [Bdellovibrionales bacterium]
MKIFFALFLFVLSVQAEPLIIAHRGASGHRPEHTLEAYSLAIEMGADFIEPDLVLTQDGVLIARHENEISLTTNAAEIYPHKKTTKIIDGEKVSGIFAEDLTLGEIKKLKARQRVFSRLKKYDDKYSIPTFEEVIQLAQSRNVGIYPEMKHPTYFETLKPSQISMIDEVARILKKYGYDKKTDQVFVQSFELSALKKLKTQIEVPFVFLLGNKKEVAFDTKGTEKEMKYGQYVKSPADFKKLKEWVVGLGPHKTYLDDANFMKNALEVGLKIHPYTFREGDTQNEYIKFYKAGVHGVFSDFPDEALKFKKIHLLQRPAR